MSLSHSGVSNSGQSRTGPYAAPIVDELAPQRLGEYQLLAKLASGGMATVYLGRRTGAGGFDRRVAIKMLHPHLAEDPDVRAMFLDEARLAAGIRHPNVVPVVDVGDEPRRGTYLVMEYIEGSDVAGILKAATKARQLIPAPVVIRLVSDMLAGLEAAHELRDASGNRLNVVHRDVSPHNLIVGIDGVARLTDFGIAKAEGRIASTKTGQLKGKLAYMAPERLRGLNDGSTAVATDHRGDLFGAAVVLWEALCGRRLFRGGDDFQTARLVLEKEIEAPSTHLPMLSPIDRIVMRGLERDPQKRYSSARDFREALDSIAPKLGGMASPSEVTGFMRALLGERLAQQRAEVEEAVLASEAAARATPQASVESRRGVPPWAAAAMVLATVLLVGGFAWWQTAPGPARVPSAPPTVAGPEPAAFESETGTAEEPIEGAEPEGANSNAVGEQTEAVGEDTTEPGTANSDSAEAAARRRRLRRRRAAAAMTTDEMQAAAAGESLPDPSPPPRMTPDSEDNVLENPYGI